MSAVDVIGVRAVLGREGRPLLVGEANPYGSDERYALYPDPPNSAGGRLCFKVLGLTVKDYIRGFDRVNLCVRKWSNEEARQRAREIVSARSSPSSRLDGSEDDIERRAGHMGFPVRGTIVLFGAKVARAFGATEFRPFEIGHASGFLTFVTLPHPSGRCLAWNEPGAYERARALLREAGVYPPPCRWCERTECTCPLDDDGGLMGTDWTTQRPARCSNCGLVVRGRDCPDCGAP